MGLIKNMSTWILVRKNKRNTGELFYKKAFSKMLTATEPEFISWYDPDIIKFDLKQHAIDYLKNNDALRTVATPAKLFW